MQSPPPPPHTHKTPSIKLGCEAQCNTSNPVVALQNHRTLWYSTIHCDWTQSALPLPGPLHVQAAICELLACTRTCETSFQSFPADAGNRKCPAVPRARSDETFVALCLLTVTGASLCTQRLGFSDTLGAFCAGVLLAETNYRTQVVRLFASPHAFSPCF